MNVRRSDMKFGNVTLAAVKIAGDFGGKSATMRAVCSPPFGLFRVSTTPREDFS